MSIGPGFGVPVNGGVEPPTEVPTVAKPQPTKLAVMLRMWLSYHGIEQRDFSVELGCSPSTVTRFLAGTAMPDGKTVARIIAWLFETPNMEFSGRGEAQQLGESDVPRSAGMEGSA